MFALHCFIFIQIQGLAIGHWSRLNFFLQEYVNISLEFSPFLTCFTPMLRIRVRVHSRMKIKRLLCIVSLIYKFRVLWSGNLWFWLDLPKDSVEVCCIFACLTDEFYSLIPLANKMCVCKSSCNYFSSQICGLKRICCIKE